MHFFANSSGLKSSLSLFGCMSEIHKLNMHVRVFSKIVTLGSLSLFLICNTPHFERHAILSFWKFSFSRPRTLLQRTVSWSKFAEDSANKEHCLPRTGIWNKGKEIKHLKCHKKKIQQCLPRRRPSRSPMVARCVPTHQLLRLIWNSTCLFTLEWSSSAANCVNTPAHGLVTSRDTC